MLEENGTLHTAAEFDYETNVSAFNLTVFATDQYGASTEGNFSLTLLDVNESIDSVSDDNQTTPPSDHNTTDPSNDHNSTVPVDNNGTNVDIDHNGTLPVDHRNTTTPNYQSGFTRTRIFPSARAYGRGRCYHLKFCHSFQES